MSALLDHELPGVDAPERVVAADRRTVAANDAVCHCRVRAACAVLLPAGIPLRHVQIAAVRPLHGSLGNAG